LAGKVVTDHLQADFALSQLKDITLAVTAPKEPNGQEPKVSAVAEDPRLSRIVQWGYDKL
jgi:hypothetical protein